MRSHPVLTAFGVGFCCATALSGCQADTGGDVPLRDVAYQSIAELQDEAREHGWETQIALLADGVVSRADYEQAVDDTRACAERRANGISEPQLSPIDNLTLEFGFPIGAMDEEDVWRISDECSQQHLWTVQTAYLATHDAVMDVDILTGALACMHDLGHTITGDVRNARDMVARVEQEAEAELVDCIAATALRLRPDRDGIGVSW